MTKHKHADLLIAYANDSSLKFQCRIDGHSIWHDVNHPKFTPGAEWRIKPEPKKAYVFMYKKGSGRWISWSCETMSDAVHYKEEIVRLGYDVTDIKEVEFV